MKHLVFLIHAAPSVVDSYRKALEGVGDVDLVLVNAGGYSSAYVGYALRHRDQDGRILQRLKAELLPSYKIQTQYDSTTCICYSAGYALVRELLHGPDAEDINAVVAIDSVHAALDPQGPGGVREEDLKVWIALAEKAKSGNFLFWLGHSDVPTPQTGPTSFASTTQVSNALEGLVPQGGNWHIHAYNVRSNPSDEHSAALVEWGPSFVREALVPFLGRTQAGKTATDVPPASWSDPTIPIGQRCVMWAEAERSMGVKEVPSGSNTSPRIQDYLAPCLRRDTGKPLNLTATNWCSAFVSAAQFACLQPGEPQSHGYRAAVVELKADLIDNGLWVPSESILRGLYTPHVGDIVVLDRSVLGHPETSWYRHTCMVTSWRAGDTFTTIGGNEGDTIGISVRRKDDPKFLGVGRRAVKTPESLTQEDKQKVLDNISLALDELARNAVT